VVGEGIDTKIYFQFGIVDLNWYGLPQPKENPESKRLSGFYCFTGI